MKELARAKEMVERLLAYMEMEGHKLPHGHPFAL